jgi:hypothetical protein
MGICSSAAAIERTLLVSLHRATSQSPDVTHMDLFFYVSLNFTHILVVDVRLSYNQTDSHSIRTL